MSTLKSAFSRPSWRYFRSKSSQRFDEAESGRMTHARVAPASPPPPSVPPLEVPPPEPAQPASITAAAPVRATAAMREDFFIFHLSSLNARVQEAPGRVAPGLNPDPLPPCRQVLNVTLSQ